MSPNGALIMSAFAAIWWVVGARASGHGSMLMYAVALLVTGAIWGVAFRLRGRGVRVDAAEESRRDRLVGIASAVEGVAILVAINVLANIGQHDLTVSVIAVIVGLHFVPIARGLPAPLYYLSAALLVGIGLAGLAVNDPNQRIFSVSLAAAVVLWLTCIAVLRKSAARA